MIKTDKESSRNDPRSNSHVQTWLALEKQKYCIIFFLDRTIRQPENTVRVRNIVNVPYPSQRKACMRHHPMLADLVSKT